MALENVIINELQFDDIFKIETLTKPLSFAELNLIKMLVKRWQFFVYSRRLLKQYFHKWKIYHKMTSVTQNETTAEKIDLLISELHKMKVKRKKFIRSNSDSMSHQKSQEKSISSECFKNRFKTQKEIIDLQKAKLEQQSRIIEDLKMGIIKDELSKSLQNTKSELREIFSKSSSKVKCKMAPHGIKLEDTLANFIVKSNKAPKFMQQMERRALERAKNREIIRERKRIIDEEKQRALEEIIEQKRIHDEEEKRRNLEAIKEKQRAELEKQKILQLNKDKYFADLKRANYFCKIKTLKRYFARLQCNVYITKNNMLRAENFHEKKTKQNSINRWRKFIDEKYRKQNEKADALFKQRALKQVWQQWRNVIVHFIFPKRFYYNNVFSFTKNLFRTRK